MDRSARTLVAVAFLTLAAFLSADLLIQRAPLNAWILPGVLALLGLVFVWLSVRPERGPAESMDAPEPAPAALTPALASGVQVFDVVRVPPVETPLPEPAPAGELAEEEGDDLTMVDGIGPKTNEALKAAGISTYAALGEMKPDAITAALHAQGVRPGGNIDTWPQQARYAARGDWSGLRRYVSRLKTDQTDDLLVLDGVGPKIAEALKTAGVGTFEAVAEQTPDDLRAIMSAANVPVVGNSIETWPRQAKLAAAEDWPGLMRYIAETKKQQESGEEA
jgi:predicted flap endonuclease-1-like 5' DNA nuclease